MIGVRKLSEDILYSVSSGLMQPSTDEGHKPLELVRVNAEWIFLTKNQTL